MMQSINQSINQLRKMNSLASLCVMLVYSCNLYIVDEAQRASNLYPSVADDTPAPIGFESQGKCI